MAAQLYSIPLFGLQLRTLTAKLRSLLAGILHSWHRSEIIQLLFQTREQCTRVQAHKEYFCLRKHMDGDSRRSGRRLRRSLLRVLSPEHLGYTAVEDMLTED